MKYIGVDMGGTNMEMALVEPSGKIVARNRRRTPRSGKSKDVLDALLDGLDELIKTNHVRTSDLVAIGIGVAGPVDPRKGMVIVTPNMSISGLQIVQPVRKRFGVPTVLGNDCNVGVLGEAWLGAAQGARDVVAIFVGTGIGGGVICHGKLLTGARNLGGEIGHVVMDPDGPRCGCGHRGCLEALASRTAIERDIRQAVAQGRHTVLTKILDGDLRLIRSKALKNALERKDPLVIEVLERAARYLGYACVTVRHLLDPEVIILGGGVMQACGDFILPIVKEVLDKRSMPGTPGRARLVRSGLGDDAGVIGAVALAQLTFGDSRKLALEAGPTYPQLRVAPSGKVCADNKCRHSDFFVRADGKVKKLKTGSLSVRAGSLSIAPDELKKLCKGAPESLVIATGDRPLALAKSALAYLERHKVRVHALPTPRALKLFNSTPGRKSALIHLEQ